VEPREELIGPFQQLPLTCPCTGAAVRRIDAAAAVVSSVVVVLNVHPATASAADEKPAEGVLALRLASCLEPTPTPLGAQLPLHRLPDLMVDEGGPLGIDEGAFLTASAHAVSAARVGHVGQHLRQRVAVPTL